MNKPVVTACLVSLALFLSAPAFAAKMKLSFGAPTVVNTFAKIKVTYSEPVTGSKEECVAALDKKVTALVPGLERLGFKCEVEEEVEYSKNAVPGNCKRAIKCKEIAQ
jgi:hypothetical protein